MRRYGNLQRFQQYYGECAGSADNKRDFDALINIR